MSQTITKTLQDTYFDELKKGGQDWENLIEIGTNALYNELLSHNITGDLDRLWDISKKGFVAAVNAWVGGQNQIMLSQSPEDVTNQNLVEPMFEKGLAPTDTLSEEYVREHQYKIKPEDENVDPTEDGDTVPDEPTEEETFEYTLTEQDLVNNPSFEEEGLKAGDVIDVPVKADFEFDEELDGKVLKAADLKKYPELGEMGYKKGDTYKKQGDIQELLKDYKKPTDTDSPVDPVDENQNA